MAEGLRRKEGKRCGFWYVLVGRLEEAKDILMAADVDPVKLEQLRLYVNEKHSVLKKLDEILELLGRLHFTGPNQIRHFTVFASHTGCGYIRHKHQMPIIIT
uniref:Uncharacterized protein n=1 Tax=Amphimedon queenslandica TaxID=400682 RepID=A0A1X7TB00_AMPQE